MGVQLPPGPIPVVGIQVVAPGEADGAGADHDPVVQGATVVVDQVPGVLHPLLPLPPDGLELLVGQGRGGLGVRERGHLLATEGGEQVGVRVGGEDHLLGRHRASRRLQADRTAIAPHARHGRILIDSGAQALREILLGTDQLERVDQHEPRLPHGPQVDGRVDPLPGLPLVQVVDVVEAEAVHELDLLADLLQVPGRGGDPEESRPDRLGIQLLALDQVPQLVDRPHHVAVGTDQVVPALDHRRGREPEPDDRHGEGPVPAAGPVADLPGLQHRDVQPGIRPPELVRRGQPGEPAADDRDVHLPVPVQGRAGRVRAVGLLPHRCGGIRQRQRHRVLSWLSGAGGAGPVNHGPRSVRVQGRGWTPAQPPDVGRYRSPSKRSVSSRRPPLTRLSAR